MSDRLDEYRRKRAGSPTPEPMGRPRPPAPGAARRFVVQKHASRNVHFDLRLEHDGILLSFAVPKGPSIDPAQKRLAMPTEDHPLEYADFEGLIPAGSYGAGAMIVWDRGTLVPLEDFTVGLSEGKLAFELHGYKLRGAFTLVRMHGKREHEWLLVKKLDAHAGADELLPQQSILSGLDVQELLGGTKRGDEVKAELVRLGAPRAEIDPETLELALAETAAPFSAKGWLFELKYDGFRILASRRGGKAQLHYRSKSDSTALFPDIARALAALPYDGLLMDGEVVVLDAAGAPRFQRLQQRTQLSRSLDVERALVEHPATVFFFDLLAFEGFDLRGLPTLTRKALLRKLVPHMGPLRFADHLEDQGEALFAEVKRLGLEGMIAKKADVPYPRGRSSQWLKVKTERTGDFVIVGFTAPKGSRSGLGAVDVAQVEDGKLVFVGKAGSGFSNEAIASLLDALVKLKRKDPPCGGPIPKERGHTWVEPVLVCELRYLSFTEEGVLRHPVFLRLRDDKRPEECLRERVIAEPLVPPPAAPREPVKKVALSNPQKIFFPAEGITKGEVYAYYDAVSRWMLPYLKDRPVVTTRFTDGIDGKSFYQHQVPGFAPGWMRTERRHSDHSDREIDYLILDDRESLLYIANLGVLPIHAWASRVSSKERPDWLSVDLDPTNASFSRAIKVARALRALCEEIGLPSFVKTSGQAGLHVLAPTGGQLDFGQARALAELLARAIARDLPEDATLEQKIADRGERVYLDVLENSLARTLAAPFCVRPKPGAPVSMPLQWSEVEEGLTPVQFTIRNAIARLERLGDPMAELLTLKPDLASVVTKLDARLRR